MIFGVMMYWCYEKKFEVIIIVVLSLNSNIAAKE